MTSQVLALPTPWVLRGQGKNWRELGEATSAGEASSRAGISPLELSINPPGKKNGFQLRIPLQRRGDILGVSVPTPPGARDPRPYLHPGFGQVRPQCQLLAGVDVGVMRLLEDLLQLLQLGRAEGRPVPPLLALALAQGLGGLGDPPFPEAARGCCQRAPQLPRGCGHPPVPDLASLLAAWQGERHKAGWC